MSGLPPLSLSILPETFAICRLEPAAPLPRWASAQPFASVTRTPDELTIVCPDGGAPSGVLAQRGFRAMVVAGPLDFAMTGVLAALAAPLAAAGVSIFAVSTYDTDYVLVRDEALPRAVEALTAAGHRFFEHKP